MGFATPFGPGVLYVVFGFVDASYRFWLEALAASELQDLPKLVLVGFLLEDDPLNQLDLPDDADEELGVDVLLPDEYDRPAAPAWRAECPRRSGCPSAASGSWGHWRPAVCRVPPPE